MTPPCKSSVIRLRKPYHSKARQRRGNPFSKGYYGLPRTFGARNDSLNEMTLPGEGGAYYRLSEEDVKMYGGSSVFLKP